MHSDYNDWVDSIPDEVIKAEAHNEMSEWDEYFRREILEDPPEQREEFCDDCGRYRIHEELADGTWRCRACGGTA